MTSDHIEQLSRLLRALPPAPRGLVQAAQELPLIRRSLDDLLARAEADAELRARLLADLESTLAAEGIDPTVRVVEEVRGRVRSF
jgi:hypothetical protein